MDLHLGQEVGWTKIEEFIGYGRRDAPVVFLGMEEGAAIDTQADLRGRSTYDAIPDMDAGHRYQPTWAKMSDLMLRRARVAPTKALRAEYQAEHLGRSTGETLVAELLPYPNRRADHWHEVFHERFPTRKAYETVMIPKRKAMLRDVRREVPRQVIVAYGKTHWTQFCDLFPEAKWTEVPPFKVSQVGCMRVVLAPHFVSRAFNGQGEALARLALE